MQFVSGKWDIEDSYDEQENVDSLKWKTEVIENDRKYRIDRQRDKWQQSHLELHFICVEHDWHIGEQKEASWREGYGLRWGNKGRDRESDRGRNGRDI